MMEEIQRYFLITGSDEICEVVRQSELFAAIHGMFCCAADLESCDNVYFEGFKAAFGDGVDFEGWMESLEDGWLDVEELPAQPKQLASQQAELERLRGALNYCVVLDNLYVGQDFTDNPQGSDAAHLRDIWRQMIEHVDCVLNLPSDAALNPPGAESGKTQ